MSKNTFSVAQLFLRITLGIGFILPVMDRFGWLGMPEVSGTVWGNWDNFVKYTNSLLPFLNEGMANVMGGVATILEIVLGITLIIGYKTKWAALGCFMLTLAFALCMFFFVDFKVPFYYSVFADSAAALLLSSLSFHKWSFDDYLANQKNKLATCPTVNRKK